MRLVLTGHPDVLVWHLEAALRDLKRYSVSRWSVQAEDEGLPHEIVFAADPVCFKPSDPLYVEKD